MKQMNFIPYESIGSIHFGESRKDVRNGNSNFQEFKKNRFSKNTTDDFGNYHVFYTESNCVEAVEVLNGIEIFLKGINITSLPLEKLIAFLSDSKMTKEDDSINFPSFGLTVSVKVDIIESYLCYKRGYWD